MKKITYVTGNWAKIDSAKQILGPKGYTIDNIKMDTIEIQADDTEEVAKFSAKWASDKLKCAVLKNDSGLFVEALNGFPGVYTHYVDETLGEDGLLKLLDGVENRRAYFKEVLAYCEYGKEPICFTAITPGIIDTKKSGTYGWSWDFVFIPDGQDKTLGCYPDEERWKFWSMEAYEKLADYLDNKKSDISFFEDKVKFNFRVGAILKYNNKMLIEKSDEVDFAVIPGGRVKLAEDTNNALNREIKEELGVNVEPLERELISVIESFFVFNDTYYHELYFVYKFDLSSDLGIIDEMLNIDSLDSKFYWHDINTLQNIKILPVELKEVATLSTFKKYIVRD